MPFETIRRLVISVLDGFRERDYFQEAFGYYCVDAGNVDGSLGADPDAFFLRTIMREGIWPYWQPDPRDDTIAFLPDRERDPTWEGWDADTMFDVIEVLHDLVSKGVDGRYHDYNGCGMHYETFDRAAGQEEFAGR